MEQLDYEESEPFIPHDVVVMVIRQNIPLVKGWRLYKSLSVEEIAKATGLKTHEVMQLEAGDNQNSNSLEKIAQGLALDIEQLVDF